MSNPTQDALTATEQSQAVEREAAVPGGEDRLAQAAEILAAEYERNRYPTYAALAREQRGAFTMCAIRAVAAALATPAHRPPQPGVVTEELRGGAAKAKQIVDLWFEPWGAAKGAKWEEATGDREFSPDIALALIRDALAAPSPGASVTPSPAAETAPDAKPISYGKLWEGYWKAISRITAAEAKCRELEGEVARWQEMYREIAAELRRITGSP